MRVFGTRKWAMYFNFSTRANTGNPGSLFGFHNMSKYREHIGLSLGLEICLKMEIKIDETYHVGMWLLSLICTRSFDEETIFLETSCAYEGQ